MGGGHVSGPKWLPYNNSFGHYLDICTTNIGILATLPIVRDDDILDASASIS